MKAMWRSMTVGLALASPVLASGDAAASNPFSGDIGNALWTLVIFVLVVVVLGRFAWGPILNALQKREDFIHDALKQAKEDREAADGRLRQYTAKLEAAQHEAGAIVEEARRDAEAVKNRIEQDARAEADKLIARARREIDVAKDTAVHELYAHSAKLATDIASKVIRKEVSIADHERLIAESIGDMEAVAARNGN